MKIKDGFTLHQIGDEYIIMYNGTQNVDFNNIISLNSTAAHLWKHVEGMDFNADTLTDFLMENYEVDSETAKRDAEQLIKNWLEAGIIKEMSYKLIHYEDKANKVHLGSISWTTGTYSPLLPHRHHWGSSLSCLYLCLQGRHRHCHRRRHRKLHHG